METLSLREARRIAIAAQGLARARPRGPVTFAHVRKMLNELQLVQLDSVNVLARAHHLAFFARLGPYDRALVDRELYERGEAFEYWAHVASLVPAGQYALMRHRMESSRRRARLQAHLFEHAGYLESVLEEVRRRGPLTVAELDDPGARTGPWWGWGKGKLAMEAHFADGTLTTRARRNFARVYDLPERVLPAAVLDAPGIAAPDAVREMLRRGALAHGVGTLADFADYYRIPVTEARPRLAELVAEGTFQEVQVEGWDKAAYLHRDALQPRKVTARALLSPFDSLVWARDRDERLFGFRYRIEIYTPGPRRVHGYYVMPFLLGEELVARVDLKAERQAGVLAVRGAFTEPGADAEVVAAALAEEVALMARWLGLGEIRVVDNGDLAPLLARRL